MVLQKLPQTLVRVGRYDFSLEEAVKKFKEPLEYTPVGLGNTVKYAAFKESEEPYLLMVSQQKDKSVHSSGYNVILTVTSYSNLGNKKIADKFEQEAEIDLSINVPSSLKIHCSKIGLSFKVFEENPQVAMAILKGII